jgi:hypothetical protein
MLSLRTTTHRGFGTVTISWARMGIVVLAVAYAVALLWVHERIIAPSFSYLGAVYIPPVSNSLLPIGYAFAIFPSVFLQNRATRPSAVFHWILYVLLYVPCILLPVISTGLGAEDLVPIQFSLFVGFMLLLAVGHLPLVQIPTLKMPVWLFWCIVLGVSIACYLLIFRQYGFRLSMPSIGSAYDLRDEYRAETESGGALAQYALHWQSKILNPLIIGYGLIKRNPLIVAFGFLGQLVIYSISGLRAVLFSIGILIAIIWCFRDNARSFGLNMIVGSVGLVVTCITVDTLMHSISMSSMFVRRLILAPGLLMGQYYEFFSQNPFVYLSNSVLSPFFDYPYDSSYGFLVGEFISGRPDAFFNAGLWPDGYAQFGLAGIVIVSALLGAVLWVLDSLALDKDKLLIAASGGLAAWSLVNSGLFTALLTHGILLFMVLVYLMPRSVATRVHRRDVVRRWIRN